MELNLKRPIIFFDLETTGVDPVHDKIVEISYIKVSPNGREESKTLRINPMRPIPEQATAVHGITNDDVKNAPRFKDVAREIARDFEGCDIAGFNSNRFDVPLLVEEFLNAGVLDFDAHRAKFVDVQTIFHKKEQRTLSAAYKFYCGLDLEGAHAAANDIKATYEVLKAQLDRYPDLQNDIEWLSEYSSHTNNVDLAGRIIKNEKGEPVFSFGKYKGMLVQDVILRDPGYYGWIMQGDFAADTKHELTKIKLQMQMPSKS